MASALRQSPCSALMPSSCGTCSISLRGCDRASRIARILFFISYEMRKSIRPFSASSCEARTCFAPRSPRKLLCDHGVGDLIHGLCQFRHPAMGLVHVGLRASGSCPRVVMSTDRHTASVAVAPGVASRRMNRLGYHRTRHTFGPSWSFAIGFASLISSVAMLSQLITNTKPLAGFRLPEPRPAC